MKLLLLVDAGHGLFTYGKRCMLALDPNETREWVLNSRIAEYLEDEMEAYEDVVVVRLDDPTGKRDVPLRERADKANKLYEQYLALKYVVIIISIHHNAGIYGGKGGGITTIVDSRRASDRSLEIRDRVYDELIASTGLKGNRSTPKSRQALSILYNTEMPGTLVEHGFMDSPTDVPRILSDEFARQCAAAHRNFAVKDYGLKKKAVKPAPKPVDDTKNYGYVTADVLNVRSGRSTGHKVVTQLKRGDKVEKLYLAKGWWSIAVPLSVDKRGYAFVSAAYIANIAPNQPKYQEGVVTPDRGLNVRKGPGTNYSTVKALRKGETVTIYEEKSGWYRIGTGQWVSATFIKK